MPNTLLLALQGPLQSWGERGRWAVRDSAPLPTKSGLIGLLGCALGWGDDAQLEQLTAALDVGVRVDGQGVALVDYHTVVGGVLAATGRIKINASTKEPETVVSWRHYLCDATFLVAIQGPEALIQRCAEAVRRPVWPPYLGRKSCPPARPLYEGEGRYDSLREALELWPRLVEGPPGAPLPLLAELPAPFGEGLRRSDELISRSRRLFAHRSVQQVLVDPPSRNEEALPCTFPS